MCARSRKELLLPFPQEKMDEILEDPEKLRVMGDMGRDLQEGGRSGLMKANLTSAQKRRTGAKRKKSIL